MAGKAMDDIKKLLLQKNRDKLVADLDLGCSNILDKLYENSILAGDELERIRLQSLTPDKTRCLLDILPDKSNEAYNVFVTSLKKDYDWLAKDLSLNHGASDDLEDEIYTDAVILGDMPRQPPHYIERTSVLNHLRDQLKKLKKNEYIILHGMAGSGKSCLAMAALDSKRLLREAFSNRIYWVSVGDAKTETDLMPHLKKLYNRLLADCPNEPLKRASGLMGSYDDWEFVRDRIKALFLNQPVRDGLLVLDGVPVLKDGDAQSFVIKAFDVGCKILVTTQQKNVIKGPFCTYLEIGGGFTEQESLALFARCLGVSADKLPDEARKIHNLCKGGPLLISLIGSLLKESKEDAICSKERWKFYVHELSKKNYQIDGPLNAIELCMSNINKDDLHYYEHFAVFVEDVNIMPKVLETIWNLEKYRVEEILTRFRSKSLLVSDYNKELQSYVCGIHDLLLAYLKKTLGKKKIQELHRKVIDRYFEKANNNWSNLPDDNYIFLYIGYHLKKAKMFDLFPVIFFDLRFIGAKLKAFGPVDLIGDYQRYRKHITCNFNEEWIQKLDEYEKFVKLHGQTLHKYPHTDVVQCALQLPRDSCLFEKAISHANASKDVLYFNFQIPQNIYSTRSSDLKVDISAACFTQNVNQILVGTAGGDIILLDHGYAAVLRRFGGHNKGCKISYLEVSPDYEHFLSVSEDGTVKLWKLADVICTDSKGKIYDENGIAMSTPSPRTRQVNWTSLFGDQPLVDVSTTFRAQNEIGDVLVSASFSNDNKYLVTGSQRGYLTVWSMDTKEEVTLIYLDRPEQRERITCCVFSWDDALVMFACDKNIFVYSVETSKYLCHFRNPSQTIRLLVLPDDPTSIVAVGDTTVSVWSWLQSMDEAGIRIFHPQSRVLDKRDNAVFKCATVTQNGAYVVAGASDSFIRLWDIHSGKLMKELHEHDGLVVSLDTYYDEDANAVHILLSGSDDRTVKQWHIQPIELQETNRSKPSVLYSLTWNIHFNRPTLAVVDSEHHVQILSGHNFTTESPRMTSEIRCLHLSTCGEKVAIGLDDGSLKEFEYKRKHCQDVARFGEAVTYVEYLNCGKQFDSAAASPVANFTPSFANGSSGISPGPSSAPILINGRSSGHCGHILVAASTCGALRVQHSTLTRRLLERNEHEGQIIKCYYLKTMEAVLSVSLDRCIRMWNSYTWESTVLQGARPDAIVNASALAPNQDMVAVIRSDGGFQIFRLLATKTGLPASVLHQGEKLAETPLRSCCFSPEGSVLAIGHDTGDITIWSVEQNVALSVLSCHKSNVRDLIFSPSSSYSDPLVLVSLGEQIIWWNMNHVIMEGLGKLKRRSRKCSAKINLDKLNLNLSPEKPNHIDDEWQRIRLGQENKPELFAAIKLSGQFATHIEASRSFTTFVTIDVSGICYIMDIMKTN